jgi:hypothetical protein
VLPIKLPIKLKLPLPVLTQPKQLSIKVNTLLVQHQEEVRVVRQNTAKYSRGKGKRNEYEICEILCQWYGIPQSFSRSKGSGAVRSIGQPGDISTPEGFIFCIEAKNDERCDFTSFLIPRGNSKKAKLQFIWEAWQQSVDATNKYNTRKHERQIFKYPCLIFTKNYEDIFIMLQQQFFLNNLNVKIPYIRFDFSNEEFGGFYIFLLQDFLDSNDPQSFIRRQ